MRVTPRVNLAGANRSCAALILVPEGIYYRASIGPFVSMKAAARVCGSLRAAGESCLVEKNDGYERGAFDQAGQGT